MILGILLAATGVLVLSIFALDRVYTAAANRQRASHQVTRALDRAAYWRLHHRYTALCSAGVTVEQAAAEAEQLTCPDEPIPYGLGTAPDPYAPAWTSGWIDGDGTHVHTEFGQVVRAWQVTR